MTELEFYREKVMKLVGESKSAADLELIYAILLKMQEHPKAS